MNTVQQDRMQNQKRRNKQRRQRLQDAGCSTTTTTLVMASMTAMMMMMMSIGGTTEAFHLPEPLRNRQGCNASSSAAHLGLWGRRRQKYDAASAASPSSSSVLMMHNKKGSSGGKKKKKNASSKSAQSSGKGFGSSSSSAATATTSSSTEGGAAGAGVLIREDKFPYAGSLRPGIQTPRKIVAEKGIVKPDYHETGRPAARRSSMMLPWMIEVKSGDEIQKMRDAGSLARDILDLAGRAVRPGVTTDEIDRIVHDEIVKRGAYPSPLNYHGFPKSCCTSVNEVICHGIPDDRELQLGDVINLDITVYLKGYHGDCSEMFYVGDERECDPATKKLLQTTYDSWIMACQFVKPGNDYKDIGAIIEDYVVPKGYSTVRQFCGHGIGQTFHTNPNILHYRNNEPNGQMATGHTFTIEPMICEGSAKALTWPDNWTATTVDGKRSAQFEHTLLVTEDGVEALTGKKATSAIHFWERESDVHRGVWLGTSRDAMSKQDEINSAVL